jgi:hypothetical protein
VGIAYFKSILALRERKVKPLNGCAGKKRKKRTRRMIGKRGSGDKRIELNWIATSLRSSQ